MKRELMVNVDVEFGVARRGRQRRPRREPSSEMPGRIPRVAKLMALAIRFDGLIREGVVADQAELARLGHVSRARVTQIMNLLNLAPDIQEQLLSLPPMESGRDRLTERALRLIVAEPDWRKQRRMFFGPELGGFREF
jgi:hypothetical protein